MEDPKKDEDGKPDAADVPDGQDPKQTVQPDPMASLQAELAQLKQQQSDIMAAVSALANQGAVNASVKADNGVDEEYPSIDLNEINRLIGA